MDQINNRKNQLQKNLEQILKTLQERYHPEQVILFGSMASGEITPTSDLDLLIIKQTNQPFYQRIREVIGMCNYDVGVDFLVYTPQELLEESAVNPFVKNEILSKGKTVYRAAA